MGQTYVNIEGMSSTLNDMLSNINTMQSHIESYDTNAEASLGESTFRPEIEGQLKGLKAGYEELIPELTAMKSKIEEVMNEYNLRAGKVSGTGTYGSSTTGSSTVAHETIV